MINDSLLSEKIIDSGYAALFREPGHEITLEKFWKSFSMEDFEKLAGDEKQDPQARFLSSLVLLNKDLTFFSRTDLYSLCKVYILALINNYTGKMSDWGFLDSHDDIGIVGGVFFLFGEKAVPELIKLLENGKIVDYERTSPSRMAFDRRILQKVRIKDFAALYLSKIKNIPIEFKTIFSERDEQIRQFKKQVGGS